MLHNVGSSIFKQEGYFLSCRLPSIKGFLILDFFISIFLFISEALKESTSLTFSVTTNFGSTITVFSSEISYSIS